MYKRTCIFYTTANVTLSPLPPMEVLEWGPYCWLPHPRDHPVNRFCRRTPIGASCAPLSVYSASPRRAFTSQGAA